MRGTERLHHALLPMRKLKQVQVLGCRVKVEYTQMEDWGECCADTRTIKLNVRCLEDDQQHWATLVHEVTHMIFHMSGVAYMERNEEEAYVRCVENLVIPWVMKNQHLI